MTCKGITKTGAPCRAKAIDGDFCEWHFGQAPSDQVTEILVESKELKAGQVKFEKAKTQRPRFWKWERKRSV